MAEVKSAKQKIEAQERAEEQKRAAAQAPGLHPKEPCNGCDEKKTKTQAKKREVKNDDASP